MDQQLFLTTGGPFIMAEIKDLETPYFYSKNIMFTRQCPTGTGRDKPGFGGFARHSGMHNSDRGSIR